MNQLSRVLAIIGLLLTLFSGTASAQPERTTKFAIVDLGALPGHVFSTALGINDEDTVIGISHPGVMYGWVAVRWDRRGVITELRPPPGRVGARRRLSTTTGRSLVGRGRRVADGR